MRPYYIFIGCLLADLILLAALPMLKAEGLDAIAILPSGVRQGVIEEAEHYSHYPLKLEVLDCKQVRLKFASREIVLPIVAESPSLSLDTKVLDPETILTEAAGLIQPRGIIIRKGVSYLVLPRKPVTAGTRLKISLEGAPYIIILAGVYPKAYTLQYQDTKKTFLLNPSLPSHPSEKALKK